MTYKFTLSISRIVQIKDPLNCTQSIDKFDCQLLHLNLFRPDNNNLIVSDVFSEFKLENNTLSLVVKNDITFSDGSKITTKDIETTIKRAAFTYPEYPVLDKIKGLDNWLRTENFSQDLEGISVSEESVTIRFKGSVDNVLYRLSDNVFSVVPHKYVDPKTAKLIDEAIPTSGPYKQTSKTASSVEYKLRKGFGPDFPKNIFLDYPAIRNESVYQTALKNNSTLLSNALELEAQKDTFDISNFNIRKTPVTRVNGLYFKRKDDFFNSQKNRLSFSTLVREYFEKNHQNATYILSFSSIPKLVPGYLDNEELKKTKIEPQKAPKGYKMYWAYGPHTQKEIYAPAIKYACEKMGIEFVKIETEKFKDFSHEKEVLSGLLADYSAQDPVGDIISWYNLSSAPKVFYDFVSRDDMQSLVRKIRSNKNNSKNELEALNKLAIEDSHEIPLIHNEWVYAVPKDAPYELVDLPQAINSPAPWQIVKMKD